MRGKIGVRRPPVDVREPEIEVAEGATDCDVGEGEGRAHAPRLFAEFAGHDFQRLPDDRAFPLHPFGAALRFRAHEFEADTDCGIQHAVGQRLPALDLDALAARLRKQLVVGRKIVEILDDDR